jgi:hypothetical protein
MVYLGIIEMTRGLGRRRKQLLSSLRERREYRKLENEALILPCEQNSLWKRLSTCCKEVYGINSVFTCVINSEFGVDVDGCSLLPALRISCRSFIH